MPSVANGGNKAVSLEAVHRLKSTELPLFLTPSPELSKAARVASENIFSFLSPHAPKSPFSNLLTEGFDTEQIWQQIDLQDQPLIPFLRRNVRNLEKNPEEVKNLFNLGGASEKEETLNEDGGDKENGIVESESEGFDDEDDDELDEDEDEEEEEGGDEDEDEDEDDGELENDEKRKSNGVEDKFLKIKELEEYLVEDESREYGLKKDQKNKRKRGQTEDDDDEDEESEEDEFDEKAQGDEDEEEDDEVGLMGLDEDDDEMENARYEDFFGGKKDVQKKKYEHSDVRDDEMDLDELDDYNNNQDNRTLSTHEKEQQKLRAEIEEMEKANLEPKKWTMQGEVTAAQRPKNSALEDPLDFVHNARPPPVITEEVTASLEELIQKRILEGRFDDIQKPPTLSTKAPREKMELDENKSKKGLAELYEDEYAQKTGLVSAALTFSDEQKKEASMLFKKLCVKLDALSHFHFTPKPIIEDMSIQTNVPALAMEEIAPLAVSDAAMLAPEEVFAGKGDVKEETELTKEDRKRRRAKKKRKFKAESTKQTAIKEQLNTSTNHSNGNEESAAV